MSETPSSPPQEEIQGWQETAEEKITKSAHPDTPPPTESFDFGTQKQETQQDITPPQVDVAVAIPQPNDLEKPADSLVTQDAPDALAPTQQETALVHAPKTEDNTAPAVRVESQEEIAPTPEQIEKKKIEYVAQVTKEIHDREEQRMIERYGEGKIGKMKRWLNETDAGRAVKIGGKIAVGTAAAIAAGTLTGGIGLLAAPMVYSLGLKTAVDGGIEAVQYLSKGRNLRLQIEGAKHSMLSNLGENADKHYEKLMKGEITQQQYNTQVGEIINGIAEQEKAIITQEQGKDVWEKKQAKLRAVISSVAAVGIGMVTGVPLGMQDFDRDGISHAVRFGRHGFNFLYNATEMMGHAGGAVGHTLGHAIDARAYAGLGLAVVGLCLKTGFELKGAAARGEITSPEPKYLEHIPQETALARVDPQTGLERAQTPPGNPVNPQSPPQAETSSTTPPQQESNTGKEIPSVRELIDNEAIPFDNFKKMIVTQGDARKLVGLPETYTKNQFNKAKREFVNYIHPDVNNQSPRSQELFKIVIPLLNQLETSALPNPENSDDVTTEIEKKNDLEKNHENIPILSEEEVRHVMERLALVGNEFRGKKLTPEFLIEKGLTPKYKMEIEGKTYWTSSKQFEYDGRTVGLAYVDDEGKTSVIPYVESGSQGTFRFYPGYVVKDKGFGEEITWFSKASGEESLQIPIELQKKLFDVRIDKVSLTEEDIELVLVGSTEKYSTTPEAVRRGSETAGVDFESHDIGGIPKSLDSLATKPENLDVTDKNDRPDFSKPLGSWEKFSSTYNGNVTYEVYKSKNGNLQYLFCRDTRGRAWIGGIEQTNSRINNKGLRQQWIEAGALTVPAFEYYQNLKHARKEDYANLTNTSGAWYVDTFDNYLSKIPMIREYLEVKIKPS